VPLAILTCHFNPQGDRQTRRNLLRFLRQMDAEGVPVYVAELAIGDENWLLPKSENVLRFRAKHGQVLWLKENLLNLAEGIVPEEFDLLAWVDADVWFQRLDWYEATEKALERHAVVQMCDLVVRTNEDGTVARRQISAAKAGSLAGQTGMAWAARRTLWTVGGGLYERAILGIGDVINAAVWLPGGGDLKWIGYSDLPAGISQQRAWAGSEGTCGYVEGTLWHEWQGDLNYRHHGSRHGWLEGLDVERHLGARADGLLEWTEDAPPGVREKISRYFARGAVRDAMQSTSVPMQPWMHKDELAAISALLQPSDRVLEFGSGGSTHWLAERVSEVHTIEHDQQWASRVIAMAPANVTLHWRRPQWAWKKGTPSQPGQFSEYLAVPAQIGRIWDAVLIDGRARLEAALGVASFLKPGGWLFFHDWFARQRYVDRLGELQASYELIDERCVRSTGQTLAVFRRRGQG
jgi:hypothetical protein